VLEALAIGTVHFKLLKDH